MERHKTEPEYHNNPELVRIHLENETAILADLDAVLMEPSTARTTEDIAALQMEKLIIKRQIGTLGARLFELGNSSMADTDRELDEIITDSERLVEVS